MPRAMLRPPSNPLVAVIGATGTGKSDLAVEIARRFNGEIINGDAMQLYHGLPIITNKITTDEMKGIPHRLLGCIGLEEETWTVSKFVENASRVIQEIRSRGKLPILVGGTHYYTQSLIFQESLAEAPIKLEEGPTDRDLTILDEPTEVLLQKLREVDPIMADRWHPKERRKIQHSLEIYLKTGKPASQIYEEQRSARRIAQDRESGREDFQSTGARLRFPTLFLWVYAEKDILNRRTDSRILKMVDRGLLSEVGTLSDFKTAYEARTGSSVDQTRGIWVSIGYKEFLEYLSALKDNSIPEKELTRLRTAAIEKMQGATRRYANRQIRWIRIKLINAIANAGSKNNLYLLDGSDLEHWHNRVVEPAVEITKAFLEGGELPLPAGFSEVAREMLTPKRDYDLAERPDLWQRRTCEVCGTVAVTESNWNAHINSRAHRRAVGTKKRLENKALHRKGTDDDSKVDPMDVLESSLDSFNEENAPKSG